MFTKFAPIFGALALPAIVSAAIMPEMSMDERYLVRRALNTGLGTRYGDDCSEEDCWQGGACAFTDYTLPEGVDGSTCVSEDIWDSAHQCGGCISVTYKGKTLKIMVTNKTGGDKNHLDMTPATWEKLTGIAPGASPGGVDGIEWEFVPCPMATTTPLWLKAHGGSSQYWPALTVENARRRTSTLEYSDDNGATWQKSTRDTNNFFVAPGTLSSNTVDVRLTSQVGTEVVVKGVNLQSGEVTKSTKNYA